MNTFQSRWGFHPCDYHVFLKLKRVHKAYWEGLRKVAAWRRWERKRPCNRVICRWQRDAAGRKITRVIAGPRPEPCVPGIYREICESEILIPQEFHNARHGRPEDQVKPLQIPLAALDRWCDELNKLGLTAGPT